MLFQLNNDILIFLMFYLSCFKSNLYKDRFINFLNLLMIMFLYRFLNYLCCKLYRKQYLGSVGHLLTQIHVN